MKSLNICIVTRSTVAHFQTGGMETHLDNLIKGFDRSGHIITVITTSFPNREGIIESADKVILKDRIKYIFIGDTTPGLNPLSKWGNFLYKIGILNRSTRIEGSKNFYDESVRVFCDEQSSHKFDILISQSTGGKKVIPHLHIPSICIIHGTIQDEIKNRIKGLKSMKNILRFLILDIPDWIFEHLTTNRILFKSVSHVVSVSESLKTSFLKQYSDYKNKISVISNGVDTKIFFPAEKSPSNFNLIYVGRMDREKGVDIVLKSIPNLPKNIPIHLYLIGEGIHMLEFQKMADNLKINEQVEFLGSLPQTKVAEYYRKSKLFVFPTRRQEGHPMTISESFCSGIPVITTKMGGLKDIVVDGKSGYFIQDESPDQLSDKITYLYEHPEKLGAMSSNARNIGQNKYSVETMTENYINLFNKILEKNVSK